MNIQNRGGLRTGKWARASRCACREAIRLGEREARTAKQPQGPAPINVEPSILLVPTALKFLAVELTRGAALMMSGISPEP